MTVLILIILCCAASIIALIYFPAPFVWISLFWLALFIHSAITARKPSIKVICFNLGLIVFLLGSIEVYLWVFPPPQNMKRYEGSFTKGYYSDHDILGYAPKKGVTVSSVKYYGEELLYDVSYTINSDGLRISPPEKAGDHGGCILFFGGSYTFGDGVNDNETMPYIVGTKSKQRVYNFGFHGYGPHQMMAALEHGLVDNILDCKPGHVIYQTIVEHVVRSVGSAPWDAYGPKYVIGEDGSAKYKGPFNSLILTKFKTAFRRSFSFKIISSYYYRRKIKNINPADIEIYLGIVASAKKIIQERYPEGMFHVLFWDKPNNPEHKISQAVLKGLKTKNIKVHLISDIVEDYQNNPALYQINPSHEKHPNPLAHRLIAEYVVDNILGE